MRLYHLLSITIYSILGLAITTAQLSTPDINTSILNPDPNKVINTSNITDPIRDGSFRIINEGDNQNLVNNVLNNQVNQEITDYDTAKNRTLDIIRRIINYILGLVALTALIYLIYHGLLILTAAGDEDQYNKGLKGIKYAAIALAGIGVSRFVVSMIFFLISVITWT
jgi:hypothetical protein